MLGPDAAAAETRLRAAIRDARLYLTDEAVVWRAVAYSHDSEHDTLWVTREARARADAARRALQPPDTAAAVDTRPTRGPRAAAARALVRLAELVHP